MHTTVSGENDQENLIEFKSNLVKFILVKTSLVNSGQVKSSQLKSSQVKSYSEERKINIKIKTKINIKRNYR